VYATACQSNDPTPWLKNFDVRRWNPTAIDPTTGGASTQTTVSVALSE
jgi:hypothetical protein